MIKSYRFLLGVAPIAILASPALAQQAPAAQAGSSTGDIVVTAQRRTESASKVPIAITAFAPNSLPKRSITTERDLQSSVPGLVIKSVASESQQTYAIRGQSVEPFSGVSPAVLAYTNDVEANNGAPGSFYDLSSVQVLKGPQGTLFGRNTTGGAILYTTTEPGDRLGGYLTQRVGNLGMFETTGAVDLPLASNIKLRVAGDYYTRNGYQYNVITGQNLGGAKRGSGRATLVVNPSDQLQNKTIAEYTESTSQPTFVSPYSAYQCGAPGLNTAGVCLFSPALDFIVAPGAWAAYLAAHPFALAGGVPAQVDYQKQLGPRRVASPQLSDGRANSWYVNNITSYEVSNALKIKNIFGYSKSKSGFAVDQTGSPFTVLVARPAAGLEAGNHFGQRNITEEFQFSGNTKNLTYVVGFYFNDALHHEEATATFFDVSPFIPGSVVPYAFDTKSVVKAGYAQATYDLSSITGVQGLKATGGFRYTWERNTLIYSDNPGTALFGQATESKLFKSPSWTAGLNWQATSDLLLYVTTRGSWRSGGFNPFAPSNPTTAEAGGGNLFLPEKTKDVEIGAKFRGMIGTAPASFEVAAFSQWLKNVQKVSYVTVNGTPSGITTNVPAARVRGVEVSGTIRPSPWLELGFNGTHLDPVFTNPNALVLGAGFTTFGPFADVARWSGSAFAEVKLPTPASLGEVSLRGDIYGQTEQYFSNLNNSINPGSKLPGYTLINLRLDCRNFLGKEGLSLAAFAKNVTNKVYYSGGIAFGAAFGTNGARFAEPRTFGAELTLKY